ncbi:hypothetical protein [Tenacibaculum xiamenense]|uniref:hypothetical protein n=1 Tax=Tenacibaculum xiamenense TaxID=1261553 RepID=UPI00389500D7
MILLYLLLGFVTAFLGYLPPSMLNITASKIRLQRSKAAAKQFVLGVALVVAIQLFIALLIVSYLKQVPSLLVILKKVAIVVFVLISLVFIYKGLSKKGSNHKEIKKNSFFLGLTLSLINMFAIPFFIVGYSYYNSQGYIMNDIVSLIIYTAGTVLGVYMALIAYVILANKYQYKLLEKVKYFNLFIGGTTGAVACYSAIMLYF